MKKLTIKEKAQRYDEAIERAKELLEIGLKDTRDKRVVLSFFPELRASEDERIRGAIIDHLKDYNLAEWAAWLENQGENHIVGNNEMVKPIDKVEQKPVVYIPKFHVGDKLVSTYNTSLTYEVLEVGHINGLGNPDYKVEIFTDGKAENPRNIHYMECYKVDEWAKLIEQKHAWSEEDEKVIHCLEYTVKHFYEDEDTIKWCCAWLKSLKERVQPQQEWSEEDDQYLLVCKNALAKYQTTDKWDASVIYRWLVKKLKSLRPQWKPNEEMLEALYRAIPKNVMEISEDEMLLDKLYQGLKYGRVLSEK